MSRVTSDGHSADTLYPTKCKIVSCCIYIRSSTTFEHATLQIYCQYRSAHSERFTLASNSFRTQVLQRLLFRLLRYLPNYSCHPNFLRRNRNVWKHNTVQLQGLTSTVCGQYCCLFTLYMDREYTPKQFIGFFTADIADRHVNKTFTSEFGPLRKELRGGQCNNNLYKRYDTVNKFIIVNSTVDLNGGGH